MAAQELPAVSSLNGKLEFDAGVLSLPSPSFVGRVAGTITVPLGDRFGLQVDLSAASAPGFTTSAALHAFTRDPQSYLIGGTLGVIRTPGAAVVAVGPEAELYFDRWTIEAWAGVSAARPNGAGPTRVTPFVMANLGFYLTDNARLTAGISSLDGYTALQVSGEYLFDQFEVPFSVTGESRVGQDGNWRVMGGLRVYFGPEPKTLMRRQREDDPSDRGAALYTAAGGKTLGGGSASGTTPLPANTTSPGDAGGTPPADDGEDPCPGGTMITDTTGTWCVIP